MTEIDFREAVRSALDEELARDERVILIGEDVALAGGVFAVTPGLLEAHGPDRVFDTPISELALAGAAFGERGHRAATRGRDHVRRLPARCSMDSLINQATKYWYLTRTSRRACRS